MNQAKFISIEFEKTILERFQVECGIEFVETTADLIEQYLVSKKNQIEFESMFMREIGLMGIEIEFYGISENRVPYQNYKTIETEIEPVI